MVLSMNANMKLLAIHESAIGGSSSAQVELQHAIKSPLLVSARAAIIVHNHPSGSTEFSSPDIALTKKVKAGFDCIGVSLLDHVVIARGGWASYMDQVGPL